MSIGTGLSRITGFLRLLVAAYALGLTSTRLADTYNLANTTPNIIYDLVLGGILSSVFVPVFVEWMAVRGRDEAWHSVRAVMTAVTVLLIAISSVTMLAAGPIIHLYTSLARGTGLAQERALATYFLVFFLPQVVFYGIGAVWTGLLNAERHFAAPMFAPVLNNLFSIVTFLAFGAMTHWHAPAPGDLTSPEKLVLALGTTAGVVGMTVVLWPVVRRTGFRWRWTWDLQDEAFRRIGRLAGWMVVYVVTNQTGYLVVILLSSKNSGWFAAYSYGLIFFQLPFGIFAVSVFTALLPAMSAAWSAGDSTRFGSLTTQGLRMTAFVMLPATFGYVAIAHPMLHLLIAHFAAKATDAALLASVSAYFMIGLFSFAAFQLLIRAFYAMQDSRTPAVINLYATGLQTVANVALFRLMGVQGLALAQTVAYTFAAVAIWIVLRRRAHELRARETVASIARSLLAGGAAGAVAFGVSQAIGHSIDVSEAFQQTVQIGAALLAGAATFLLIALGLRMEELRNIKLLVSRSERRR